MQILELLSKYPRSVAALFAAIFAGLVALFACSIVGETPGIYIVSAMCSAALWAAILGRRITDVTHACKYFRAALLGALIGLLTAFSVVVLVYEELRLEVTIHGLEAVQQTPRYAVMEELASNPRGVLFLLHIVGAYFASIGAIGGLLLRWLRTLYELDEANEEYEGDDRPCLRQDEE